jgi:hypothetical protein
MMTAPAGVLAPEAPAPSFDTKRRRTRTTESATAQRASRPLTYAVVLIVAAAAVAAGLLVGRSGKSTRSAAFANSATVGHLQLRYPSNWQLAASPPKLPGIAFANPIVLTAARNGAQLAAGEVADAGGPTLLPASFRASVQGGLPAPDPISLGPLEGYRYLSLRVAGVAAPVTLYVIPTSAGVATVACVLATGPASAAPTQCAQIAASLRLLGATPFPLGPSAAYARLLSHTFSSLRADTRAGLAALKSAVTPAGQATAARRVAAAYATAARSLRSATISPSAKDANGAIVTALGRIAHGYSRAATAAAAGATGIFARAGGQIASGSNALSSALRQLAALGYRVGRLG